MDSFLLLIREFQSGLMHRFMQSGGLHLRIARTATPATHARAARRRADGNKVGVPFRWKSDVSGIDSYHIAALSLLVFTTASSAGGLLALILAGCHLCPPSLVTELFRECTIGGLSSGLISVLLGHGPRK